MLTMLEIEREVADIARGESGQVCGVTVDRQSDGAWRVDGRFSLGLVAAIRYVFESQDERV